MPGLWLCRRKPKADISPLSTPTSLLIPSSPFPPPPSPISPLTSSSASSTPPTPPPKPRKVTDAAVRRIEAEVKLLAEQSQTIHCLLAKLQVAVKDRTHPLSAETGRLRAFTAGTNIPGNLHFLSGPPPAAHDLGLVVYVNDNRTPTMRAFLDDLGEELSKPVSAELGAIPRVMQMRGEVDRLQKDALRQLCKVNELFERQVQGNHRERARAIQRIGAMLEDFAKANLELLEKQEASMATGRSSTGEAGLSHHVGGL